MWINKAAFNDNFYKANAPLGKKKTSLHQCLQDIQPSKLYTRASSKLERTAGSLRDGDALSEMEKSLAPSKLVL